MVGLEPIIDDARLIQNAAPMAPSLNKTERSLMTTLSGCHMTQWIYIIPLNKLPKRPLPTNRDNSSKKEVALYWKYDCLEEPLERRLPNVTMLREGDTIYIPIKKLQGFVINELANVTVPIVIVSGQRNLLKTWPITDENLAAMLQNKMVLAWFCHNLDRYSDKYMHHPKLHPWPYGLSDAPFRHEYAKRQTYRDAAELSPPKDTILHLAYFSLHTNPERSFIPNGISTTNLTDYWDRMSRAHFIFSPNGDRSECYRHYEAIGLGTLPITQLDPHFHRHLAGSVIFNNTNWSVDYWNNTEALQRHTGVNRELIFEDYWISYADRLVGRPLNWASAGS